MKAQYICPTIYEIDTESLMDGEIEGGGGSIVANPNQAKEYNIGFDDAFLFADYDEESGDEFGGTLKKAMEQAHYNVWEQ